MDTDYNKWLYVAPKFDVVMVLCSKHELTDIKILGSGKLQLNSMCKAYGIRILIQAHSILVSNHTSKDVIPPLSLEYDCCGSAHQNFKLNELHLQIPLRSVTNSLDDFRIVSHKVDDVENLILEQDWQIKHSRVDSNLIFLSYVGMVTTSPTLICLWCCFFEVLLQMMS
jgi:hypothetical protein